MKKPPAPPEDRPPAPIISKIVPKLDRLEAALIRNLEKSAGRPFGADEIAAVLQQEKDAVALRKAQFIERTHEDALKATQRGRGRPMDDNTDFPLPEKLGKRWVWRRSQVSNIRRVLAGKPVQAVEWKWEDGFVTINQLAKEVCVDPRTITRRVEKAREAKGKDWIDAKSKHNEISRYCRVTSDKIKKMINNGNYAGTLADHLAMGANGAFYAVEQLLHAAVCAQVGEVLSQFDPKIDNPEIPGNVTFNGVDYWLHKADEAFGLMKNELETAWEKIAIQATATDQL